MLTESCKNYIEQVFSTNPSRTISRQSFLNYLFIFSLCLPLGLASFFHPGNSLMFKSVVSMLELLSIALFFLRAQKSEIQPVDVRLNIYGLIFIFWLVWGVFSVTNSNHVFYASIRQMEWMVHILFGYVVFRFLKENFESIRYIHLIPIVGFFLIAVSLVVFWFLTPNPQDYNWLRPPFFTHIRQITYFAVAALLLLPVKKDRFWMWLPVLTVIWGVLFWSGGRAGILSACFGICLVAGLRRQWSLIFYHAIAAFLGFQLSLLFSVNIKWLGLNSALKRTANSVDINKLLSNRPVIWEWSMNALKNNLMFGVGPEGFRFLMKSQEWKISQPHGTWLQIFLEWGIPGALAFFILQVKGLQKIWQNRSQLLQNDYAAACFAMVFSFVLFSLVDGLYYHSIPMILLAYAYAVIFALIYHKQPSLRKELSN